MRIYHIVCVAVCLFASGCANIQQAVDGYSAAASGIYLNPDQIQLILTGGMLIVGTIGIFFPDKKGHVK